MHSSRLLRRPCERVYDGAGVRRLRGKALQQETFQHDAHSPEVGRLRADLQQACLGHRLYRLSVSAIGQVEQRGDFHEREPKALRALDERDPPDRVFGIETDCTGLRRDREQFSPLVVPHGLHADAGGVRYLTDRQSLRMSVSGLSRRVPRPWVSSGSTQVHVPGSIVRLRAMNEAVVDPDPSDSPIVAVLDPSPVRHGANGISRHVLWASGLRLADACAHRENCMSRTFESQKACPPRLTNCPSAVRSTYSTGALDGSLKSGLTLYPGTALTIKIAASRDVRRSGLSLFETSHQGSQT